MITDRAQLCRNPHEDRIPDGVFGEVAGDYETFLGERRALMATKIRRDFVSL